MLESGQCLLLFVLVAGDFHLDMCMPGIRTDVHLGHIDRGQPGIAHFEADDFGKLLPESLGDP